MKKIILDEKRVKKQYTFRMYTDLHEKLREIAKENNTTIVSILEHAIKKLAEDLKN